jgi:hypothetical protein
VKSLVINPKDNTELRFITEVLKNLGIESAFVSEGELEDRILSKLLKKTYQTQKTSRSEIMRKLSTSES